MVRIKINNDFTDTPGARYKEDGEYSGEQFFIQLLKPKYLEAKQDNQKLLVDLDDTWGYASSFISGSFGELSRIYGSQEVLSILELKSDDDPKLIDEIKKIIISPEAR